VLSALVSAFATMSFVCPHTGKSFDTKRELNQHIMRTRYTFADASDSSWSKAPGDIEGNPVRLANLSGCSVTLLDHTEQVTIDGCRGCAILITACCSTVFIRNCHDCFIAAACKQVYVRSSSRTRLSIYSQKPVMLEDSSEISVSPLGVHFPRAYELWRLAGLRTTADKPKLNRCREVQDSSAPEDPEEGVHPFDRRTPVPKPNFRLRSCQGWPEALPAPDFGEIASEPVQNPLSDCFPTGLEVEARFGGGEQWFGGSIDAIKADGTYSVRYDDGDFEESVPPGYLRAWLGPDDETEEGVMKAEGAVRGENGEEQQQIERGSAAVASASGADADGEPPAFAPPVVATVDAEPPAFVPPVVATVEAEPPAFVPPVVATISAELPASLPLVVATVDAEDRGEECASASMPPLPPAAASDRCSTGPLVADVDRRGPPTPERELARGAPIRQPQGQGSPLLGPGRMAVNVRYANGESLGWLAKHGGKSKDPRLRKPKAVAGQEAPVP
jgi:hypothetical protein